MNLRNADIGARMLRNLVYPITAAAGLLGYQKLKGSWSNPYSNISKLNSRFQQIRNKPISRNRKTPLYRRPL